jgi:hypothetical protein
VDQRREPSETGPAGSAPEERLAEALSHALAPDLAARRETALHLSELLLDAAECAVPFTSGGDAAEALSALELLATRADVFAWDGPPGWDELLARGLIGRAPFEPGASVLDGLGSLSGRAAQREQLFAAARAEAARLLETARSAAALGSAEAAAEDTADAAQTPRLGAGARVVAAHASLLRLIGHAAAASALWLPEAEDPGGIGLPAAQALAAEMDARAAAGSDFAAALEEWLARLSAQNRSAAQPGFRTFFAGLSQVPRTALGLRVFRDEAREGRLAADCEALLGAVGGWQPVRWASLRAGAPAAWMAELCPAAPPGEAPLARLARECDAALDVAGRLWFASGFSLAAFTSLASLLTARCASAFALWEELGGGSRRDETPPPLTSAPPR